MNDIHRPDAHISSVMMEGYVLGQLTEREREQVDAHLLTCYACLQLLMTTEPVLDPHIRHPDLSGLERQVISKLHATERRRRRPRLRWLQRSSMQYTIAASITLVLCFSGTFSNIATTLAELEMDAAIKHQETIFRTPSEPDSRAESWSEQMVNRTGSWLDNLKASRFEHVKQGEAGRFDD